MTPALARNALATLHGNPCRSERRFHTTASRFDHDGTAFRTRVPDGDVDRVDPLLGGERDVFRHEDDIRRPLVDKARERIRKNYAEGRIEVADQIDGNGNANVRSERDRLRRLHVPSMPAATVIRLRAG